MPAWLNRTSTETNQNHVEMTTAHSTKTETIPSCKHPCGWVTRRRNHVPGYYCSDCNTWERMMSPSDYGFHI